MNPCRQTHGDKKFYPLEQNPIDILVSGNYTKVPIMAGATKNEGKLDFSAPTQHTFYHTKVDFS